MSKAEVFKMKEYRYDMSDFLIHFTHRKSDLQPFEVLLKIIEDGFIQFGWAVRNGIRTVYGKRPVVCFTEMPLFAFWQYVNRSNWDLVSPYGIALPKDWMFSFGARNVIYGTSKYSTKIRDINDPDILKLDGAQLPDEDLYRYIMTDMLGYKDWIHEREWRWSDVNSTSRFNGLPVWKLNRPNDYTFSLSLIFIIVRTEEEAQIVLEKLAQMLKKDSETYDYSAIKSTKIIVKDTISPTFEENTDYSDWEKEHLYKNTLSFTDIQKYKLYKSLI